MDLVAGFEWDPHKGRANVRRHGVEFADAVAVFEDERATASEWRQYLGEGR